MTPKPYYLYIMTSARNGSLYIGVTADLKGRVRDHRTPRANAGPADDLRGAIRRRRADAARALVSSSDNPVVDKLVYFECHDDIHGAVHQEKRLNDWPRPWQKNLIEKINPHWEDLYERVEAIEQIVTDDADDNMVDSADGMGPVVCATFATPPDDADGQNTTMISSV